MRSLGIFLLASLMSFASSAGARQFARPKIRQMVAADGYTCVVLDDGVGKCWGAESSMHRNAPIAAGRIILQTLNVGGKIRQLASGAGFQCALLETGEIKCFGGNDRGQLGFQDSGHQGEVRFGSLGKTAKLKSVDLGPNAKAMQVVAGQKFACALLVTGDVKCWGDNHNGIVRRLTQDEREDPAYGDQTIGGRSGEMGVKLPRVALARKAVSLFAGGFHACAVLDNRQIQCWGENSVGQIGAGSSVNPLQTEKDPISFVDLGVPLDRVTEVRAGVDFNCALIQGDVRCWGSGTTGALGTELSSPIGLRPDQMGKGLVSARVEPGLPVLTIASSPLSFFNCAIILTGAVKCWGFNFHGQLGVGDTNWRGHEEGTMGDGLPSVDLGYGERAISIATGYDHACAILPGDRVKCWGNNEFGQLGNRDRDSRGDRPGSMGSALTEVEYWK